MARHDQRDRVGGAGLRHRARRGRAADRLRHLLVGAHLAVGNRPEGTPHLLLERGAPDVDGRAILGARRQLPADRGDVRAQAGVRSGQLGAGKLGREVGFERASVVAEHHPADAAIGGGHQQLPERRGGDDGADALAGAAAAVGARCHAEMAAGLFVDGAARSVADVVGRGGHGDSFLEARAQSRRAAFVGVRLRRGADGPGEGSLQVERADAARRTERGQREAAVAVGVDVGVDQPAGAFDGADGGRRRGGAGRMTPAAGAESRPLPHRRRREQAHAIAARPARRARRPAEDVRAGDAVDEPSIDARIPGLDGTPGGVRDGGGSKGP
jgi:hypothetical protein